MMVFGPELDEESGIVRELEWVILDASSVGGYQRVVARC
jgi:hypothetical protein